MNWKFVGRLIFSAVLLGILLHSFDWQAVMAAFRAMNGRWLLAAMLGVVVAVVISVIKWRLVLQALDLPLPWISLWRAYWIGLFFNNFLPSSFGGDGARILYAGRESGNYPGISLSVITERILATGALALLGWGAALGQGLNAYNIRAVFALLFLISLALLAILLGGRLPGALRQRTAGAVVNFLRALASQGRLLGNQKDKLWWAFLWSLVFQLVNVGINYALLRSLQAEQISFTPLLAIIPATAAVAMVPLAVNGYGLREGAYVLLLAPWGVAETVALSASLIYALAVSFLSLWGGWLWLLHRRKGQVHVK